jgi:hypothetical protein
VFKNEYGGIDFNSKGDFQLADFYAPDDSSKAGSSNEK